MRSTSCIVALACFLLLSGCAAKSSPKQQPQHTVNLDFNGSQTCQAFFIQDDAVAYTFIKEGTYNIDHGKYLFIYSCGNSNGIHMNSPYLAGKTTSISGNPGIKHVQ